MGDVARKDFTIVQQDDVVFDVIRRMSRQGVTMALVVEIPNKRAIPRPQQIRGVITKEQRPIRWPKQCRFIRANARDMNIKGVLRLGARNVGASRPKRALPKFIKFWHSLLDSQDASDLH